MQTCTQVSSSCLAWSSPASCGSGQACAGTACSANSISAQWTVLLYISADNTLEADAIFNLQQLSQVGSTSSVNFVAQVNRGLKYSTAPIGNISWTAPGAKRLLVNNGSFTQLADLGSIDSADQTVLTDFINWGVTSYPAEHYMVVFWDHGGSWSGGFGVDETHSDVVTIPRLQAALTAGLAGTAVSKFDLLGFDACLMASVEVLDALGGFVNYYVGSEEEEPGYGWDYTKFQDIHDAPATDPIQVGKDIVDGFVAQNTDATATLALLDVSQFAAARAQVSAAATQLQGALPGAAVQLAQARAATLEFGKSSDPSSSFNQVDFGDLLNQMASMDASFSAVATSASAALASTVIYKQGGAGEGNAHGLSIYFPPLQSAYNTDYDSLSDMSDWRAMLDAFYGLGNSLATPVFASGAALAVTTDGSNDIVVTGALDATTSASVATSTFYYGFSFPESTPGAGDDQVALFGDEPASFTSQSATQSWNRQLLLLTDANSAKAYSYLSLSKQGTDQIASVPIAYLPPGVTACSNAQTLLAVRQLIIDNTGAIKEDTLYATQNGTQSQLTPAAGSHLETVALTYTGSKNFTQAATSSGWGCTGTMLAASPLPTLSFYAPSIAGQTFEYALDLTIDNAAGKGSSLAAFGSY